MIAGTVLIALGVLYLFRRSSRNHRNRIPEDGAGIETFGSSGPTQDVISTTPQYDSGMEVSTQPQIVVVGPSEDEFPEHEKYYVDGQQEVHHQVERPMTAQELYGSERERAELDANPPTRGDNP